MNRIRLPRALAAAALTLVTAATAAGAQQTADVAVATVEGSRTWAVTTLTGDTLTGLSLRPGGAGAPFAVRVTDVAYDRQGYQVTAMLSDLYPWDAVAGYDCDGTPIGSEQLGIAFPTDPAQVTDVAGLVTGLVDFSGTVADDSLLLSLGLDPADLLNGDLDLLVADVATTLQTVTNGDAFSGLEAALPIEVLTGAGGDFTGSAAHPSCGVADGTVTQLAVQTGEAQSTADLLAWLQGGLDGVFTTLSGDGTLTTAEATAGGLVGGTALEEAVRQALIDAGADPLLISDTDLAAVMDVVTAAAIDLDDLLLQSGLYVSLPQLTIDPSTTAPTGLYKGRMTFTIVDPYPAPTP